MTMTIAVGHRNIVPEKHLLMGKLTSDSNCSSVLKFLSRFDNWRLQEEENVLNILYTALLCHLRHLDVLVHMCGLYRYGLFFVYNVMINDINMCNTRYFCLLTKRHVMSEVSPPSSLTFLQSCPHMQR